MRDMPTFDSFYAQNCSRSPQPNPIPFTLRQGGWDYPRHEIMTWTVPLTQAGTNPDVLEVEIM